MKKLSFLVLVCAAGCYLPADGGSGGGDGGAGDGGGSAGRSELADGSLGSSCGTCDAGLTCGDAPGGYCTKACAAADDCGTAGQCYGLTGGGAACFRSCGDDGDCRPGYACAGDAGYEVCVPGQSGGATCDGACAHYLGCKGISDAATTNQCVAGCHDAAPTAAWLEAYVATDCQTAIAAVEGDGSGTGGGQTSECDGCVRDGDSCVWLSQSDWGAGPYSGAAWDCDPSCC